MHRHFMRNWLDSAAGWTPANIPPKPTRYRGTTARWKDLVSAKDQRRNYPGPPMSSPKESEGIQMIQQVIVGFRKGDLGAIKHSLCFRQVDHAIRDQRTLNEPDPSIQS